MSASRRRVAVDLRALVPAPSGIGVFTRGMLLALARRGGFDYLGLAHRPPHHGDELRAAGVKVEHQAAPLGVVWQQLVLPRRLGRGDVDLLWSPITTLPVRSPVEGVATVHDLTALLLPETHRARVRWSVVPFLRPTLERARRVVASSEATARDLRFYFPQCADRLRVVHLGVDEEFRPGEPEAIAATRAGLGAPGGYLFFAGTLEPRKGVDTLLDAWEMLRRDDPEAPPLVLAGPYGWRSPQLLRRMARLEPRGVRYLGRVERRRLIELFQAARLFVYPSIYEGFGLPPAEALACALPVVASAAASLPEVVGEAGVLVAPQDAAALAAALQQVLADPAREAELRQRAPAQAARFSWERAAGAMEEVFEEALA